MLEPVGKAIHETLDAVGGGHIAFDRATPGIRNLLVRARTSPRPVLHGQPVDERLETDDLPVLARLGQMDQRCRAIGHIGVLAPYPTDMLRIEPDNQAGRSELLARGLGRAVERRLEPDGLERGPSPHAEREPLDHQGSRGHDPKLGSMPPEKLAGQDRSSGIPGAQEQQIDRTGTAHRGAQPVVDDPVVVVDVVVEAVVEAAVVGVVDGVLDGAVDGVVCGAVMVVAVTGTDVVVDEFEPGAIVEVVVVTAVVVVAGRNVA